MNIIAIIARRTVQDEFKSIYTDRDPNYNDSLLRFPEPSKRYIDLRPKMGLQLALVAPAASNLEK